MIETHLLEHWTLPVGHEILEDSSLTLGSIRERLGLPSMNNEYHSPVITLGAGGAATRVIIGSGTRTNHHYDAEVSSLAEDKRAIGIDPAITIRDASTANAGDMVLGRTTGCQQIIEGLPQAQDVYYVDCGNTTLYYHVDALLMTALRQPERLSPVVDYIRANPYSTIEIYTLDAHMMTFIEWLAQQSGVESLAVNANSPEVDRIWNNKRILHPTVAEAAQLEDEVSPEVLLRDEHSHTLIAQLVPSSEGFPGYIGDTVEDVLAGIAMLHKRYGITSVCLKPAAGTTGSGIIKGVSYSSTVEKLQHLFDEHHVGVEQGIVIEPMITYRTVTVAGHEIILAPSAHIIAGIVPQSMTLQIVPDGKEWGGNISVDRENATLLGIDEELFDYVLSMTQEIAQNGKEIGLVKGGIDYAIGTIGGIFGDTVFCVPLDPNFRANGGEINQKHHRGNSQVTTLVMRPQRGSIAEAMQCIATGGGDISVHGVAWTPGGWGMIAVYGKTSEESYGNALAVEQSLHRQEMIKLLHE